MDCRYINLDAQPARREQIEKDFKERVRLPWTLRRFAARTPHDVLARGVQGAISAPEKACFLSHLDLVSENQSSAEPLFVLEDDTTFGLSTQASIEEWLHKLSRTPWDILFTDLTIADVPTMAQLFRMKREMRASRSLTLIDLALIPFAGAMGYVVNAGSRAKLASLLRGIGRLDKPYDLCLRDLVAQRALIGIALFPFVTTSSQHSQNSQIQISAASTTELLLETFRRLTWQEGQPHDTSLAISQLRGRLCDDELDAFGSIVAAMSSEKLLVK